jgi:hypothetical protein
MKGVGLPSYLEEGEKEGNEVVLYYGDLSGDLLQMGKTSTIVPCKKIYFYSYSAFSFL